jgi:uncharacterized protein YyaL (SSP411 family)
MKLITVLFVLLSNTLLYAQNASEIKWIGIEEAFKLNKESKDQKPIFIDVYTDWCGWCKRLDATTYKDSTLVNYLNKNYYCVKLNAEQKEDIVFNNKTYHLIEQGRSKYHEFAVALLDGQMAYPSMVVLSPANKKINAFAGYMSASAMLQKLHLQ